MAEPTNEMSNESIAILKEMMELGASWCVSEDTVNQPIIGLDKDGQSNEMVLKGTLKNLTKESSLQLSDHQTWKGHFVRLYPNPLRTVGHFTHSNAMSLGIEAAVVYKGKNCRGDLCGWLLAWSDCDGKLKVYADCGLETKFKGIVWEEIEIKLHDSKSTTANVHDKETGATIVANLDGFGGRDYLAAAFFFSD